MHTYSSALEAIRGEVRTFGSENAELDKLSGRVLAEPVFSPLDLPPFDNSSVDGYGIRVGDAVGGQRLQVIGEIAAGGDPATVPIGGGQTVRLFTGSPIPNGVDTVVMQEDTHREGEFLYVDTTLQKGENIRGRGTELASGTEVLRGGTYVNPPVISLLATLGRSSANVYRRPAVGIVSTGSELALPGTPLLTGQIYESITAGLRSAIIRAGATVDSCRLVADDPDDTESAMREALRSDVTITCGGVSVGDHDLVKATFTRLGVTERFWRVAIRPGKPFFFGVGPNGNPVFGLPGNPVSALVTFFLFVRPALRAMVGLAAEPSALIGLGQDWPEIGDRDDFVRAAVLDGRAWPTRAQGSHMLTGLAQADVLIRLPAGSGPYRAGQPVEAWHLDW